MASKLLKLTAITEVPIKPFEKKLSIGQLENEMHARELALRMGQRYLITAEQIKKGDIVTLSLASENSWFQRERCSLNVGLGLFSEALEEKLPGRKVQESFSLFIGGSSVQITVLAVQRVIIPPFNDALIRKVLPEGAHTVLAYRSLLKEKFRSYNEEKYLDWYSRQVFDKWCSLSQWDIDMQELEEAVARCRREWVQDAAVMPDGSEEEELEDMFVSESLFNIQLPLIAQKLFPGKTEDLWETTKAYLRPYVEPQYRLVISEE